MSNENDGVVKMHEKTKRLQAEVERGNDWRVSAELRSAEILRLQAENERLLRSVRSANDIILQQRGELDRGAMERARLQAEVERLTRIAQDRAGMIDGLREWVGDRITENENMEAEVKQLTQQRDDALDEARQLRGANRLTAQQADAATEIDCEYASRLAFMLECMLVDSNGHWNQAAALLDEYKAKWEAINPSPPTFMGEPMPTERRERLVKALADRAEITQRSRTNHAQHGGDDANTPV